MTACQQWWRPAAPSAAGPVLLNIFDAFGGPSATLAGRTSVGAPVPWTAVVGALTLNGDGGLSCNTAGPNTCDVAFEAVLPPTVALRMEFSTAGAATDIGFWRLALAGGGFDMLLQVNFYTATSITAFASSNLVEVDASYPTPGGTFGITFYFDAATGVGALVLDGETPVGITASAFTPFTSPTLVRLACVGFADPPPTLDAVHVWDNS